MKEWNRYLALIGLLGAAVAQAADLGFNSGSTGAYGAMNINANTTLDLPADGVFHCTTINVAQGATLRFNRNPLNTPVYLLATGDVVIAGTVDVSGADSTSLLPGKGGPGGFDGGGAGVGGLPGGNGQGPGGAKPGVFNGGFSAYPGNGAYGVPYNNGSANNGAPYGSPLLVPLLGGSGGGGSTLPSGGGGGGGAILIGSNTKVTITGTVAARGGYNPAGISVGSGGAIRLVSYEVAGNGTLATQGGGQSANYGRVRIDAIVRTAAAFNIPGPWTYGGFMAVFPSPLPRLDITSAAGNAIPEGASAGVTLNLPFGTSPNQNITVQARDFGGSVPIRLVLTPESGAAVSYDATIDNAAANPASVTIPVTVPLSTVVNVSAWTR